MEMEFEGLVVTEYDGEVVGVVEVGKNIWVFCLERGCLLGCWTEKADALMNSEG